MFYGDSPILFFKRAERYSLLSLLIAEMSAGHGLNSTSELTQRALLVLPRDIEGAEVLLHAHEQIMVTCGISSAAAKDSVNHDNLLLYDKSLFTLQVFTIVKVLVGAGSETAERKLKYHLIRDLI